MATEPYKLNGCVSESWEPYKYIQTPKISKTTKKNSQLFHWHYPFQPKFKIALQLRVVAILLGCQNILHSFSIKLFKIFIESRKKFDCDMGIRTNACRATKLCMYGQNICVHQTLMAKIPIVPYQYYGCFYTPQYFMQIKKRPAIRPPRDQLY